MSDFQQHLTLLIGVLFLTALLVALITQLSRRYHPSLYYLAMLLGVLGAFAAGFLTWKCMMFVGFADLDARPIGGLVVLLSLIGGGALLDAFDTNVPPIKLLK